MSTLTAPVVSSPNAERLTARDPYWIGDGPDLALRPGTIGWSIDDLEDPDVHFLWAEGSTKSTRGC